jgi:hypothetical protein
MGFALLYRKSHIRRRDLAPGAQSLNHRNLVLNGVYRQPPQLPALLSISSHRAYATTTLHALP